MNLVPSLVVPLLLALPQEGGQPDLHTRAVVLQVRNEPGYSAEALKEMINRSLQFASAIDARLVSQALLETREIRAGEITVVAEQQAPEILTLGFAGVDADAVGKVMEDFVHHLLALKPTQRQAAEESLGLATSAFEAARKALTATQDAKKAFVQKNGAANVGQMLQQARDQMNQRQNELSSLEFSDGTNRALADFLTSAVDAARKSGGPGEHAESDLEALKAERDAAQKQLADMTPRLLPDHPDVTKATGRLKDLSAKIAELEGRRMAGANGPNVGELEARLFSVSQDLAMGAKRRELLAKSIADLEKTTRELAILQSAWDDLEDTFNYARQDMQNARQRLAEAEAMAQRALAGPWIQVIAR